MSETDLLQPGRDNAQSWTRVVRERALASRVAVTDSALLQAVGNAAGGEDLTLLDLGCGEGWLVVLGLSSGQIDQVRRGGESSGEYRLVSSLHR